MAFKQVVEMPLQVMKESIVRRTEYEEEVITAERMRRTEKGRSPVRHLVAEEEINFVDQSQRKALLMDIVWAMSKDRPCSGTLKIVQEILTKELAEVARELDDELPFH